MGVPHLSSIDWWILHEINHPAIQWPFQEP